MRNEEIQAELAALRAEVVALAAAREQAAEPDPGPEPEAPADASTLVAEEDGESGGEGEGFKGEIQELMGLLESELRETPMVSGLVIFSLGILVGRFLR